jgi:small redox-active disulfide protein 2
MKMIIKILGTGCSKCIFLGKSVDQALADLNMSAEVIKVTELADIVGYGVMSTPALKKKKKVIMSGRVLSTEQVKTILTSSTG